ncbi:MAG: response regulator transcription factor [Alphaproteobacteria bacterium]|nr:response regulator transcription factor [Alphaproteobacteria bacterium]
MRLLVVEDEPAIAADIAAALERAGYVADVVRDGEDAWFQAETEAYDGIVLDLGLPRLDGLTVLKRLRAAGVAVPVLILTARDSWSERVAGIDAGADDYLGKPFHSEELLARIGAILRRAAGHATPLLEAGGVSVDTRRMLVHLGGRQLALTALEFRALRYLVHHKGRVISQGELAEHVYGQQEAPDSNAVEVLIGRLRRKLGVELIVTRRGYGYLIDG